VPTRAEWATKADAICAKALGQLNGLPQPKSLQELANQLSLATVSFNRVIAQIQALTPPPADALRVKRLLVAMRANVKTLTRSRANEPFGGLGPSR
jgi:methylphosphotriester-DNA--protein-cysteine methyltransferase